MSENMTIGDFQSDGRTTAIKWLLLTVSVLVYTTGIIYAEVHGLNLLTKGVNPDFLLWAYVGMAALGLSALALPLALHFWFHSPLQKIMGLSFYAVDLGLLIFNAIGDYNVNVGGDLPFWMSQYLTFVVPITPILVALSWSLMWLIDPSSQERALLEGLRASTRMALASKVAQAARQTDVNDLVDVAASNLVNDIVLQTLGERTTKRKPSELVLDGIARDAKEPEKRRRKIYAWQRNGHKQYEAETERPNVDLNQVKGER